MKIELFHWLVSVLPSCEGRCEDGPGWDSPRIFLWVWKRAYGCGLSCCVAHSRVPLEMTVGVDDAGVNLRTKHWYVDNLFPQRFGEVTQSERKTGYAPSLKKRKKEKRDAFGSF